MNPDWFPPPEDFDKPTRNAWSCGEYWHNLFARNRNYPNCPVRVLEGFCDLPYDAWRLVADMRLTGWTVNGTAARVECLDLLSLASKVELPFTVPDSCFVIGDPASGIKAAATTLKVSSNQVIPDPAAYPDLQVIVEVGGTDGFKDDANPYAPSELMQVLAVSGKGQGNEYIQVRRGAYGTAARDFPPVSGVSSFRWRHVYVCGTEGTASAPERCTKNAVDALRELVLWAGVPADRIDRDSFDAAKAAFYPTLNFSRRIDSPTAVSDLIAEVDGSLTSTVFVNGEHKVACRVVGPPGAGEAVPTLTDGADILEGSVSVEDDPSTRITRCFVYFYPRTTDSSTDPKDFNRCAGVVDEELEAPQSYGDVVADWRTSAWFVVDESDAAVKDIVRRRIALLRDGTRKITFRVDARNGGLDYGDFVRVSTREALGIDGKPDGALYMIVKKSRTNDRSRSRSRTTPRRGSRAASSTSTPGRRTARPTPRTSTAAPASSTRSSRPRRATATSWPTGGPPPGSSSTSRTRRSRTSSGGASRCSGTGRGRSPSASTRGTAASTTATSSVSRPARRWGSTGSPTARST
jgi:hypothetical protein